MCKWIFHVAVAWLIFIALRRVYVLLPTLPFVDGAFMQYVCASAFFVSIFKMFNVYFLFYLMSCYIVYVCLKTCDKYTRMIL